MENKDLTKKTDTKYAVSKSANEEIRNILTDMYTFARLAFSKNLVENIENMRKERLEKGLYYPWETIN